MRDDGEPADALDAARIGSGRDPLAMRPVASSTATTCASVSAVTSASGPAAAASASGTARSANGARPPRRETHACPCPLYVRRVPRGPSPRTARRPRPAADRVCADRRGGGARALEQRRGRAMMRAKRRSERPDWRVPSSWPLRRSSRSTSASSKPSVVSTSACEPLLRRLRQLVLHPRHEQAVRLLRAAADAAAQLMQLREAEAVGLLDDHHRRVRNVDADLDHRRRDEHVELARLEARPSGRGARAGFSRPCRQPTRKLAQLGAAQPVGLLLGRAGDATSPTPRRAGRRRTPGGPRAGAASGACTPRTRGPPESRP